MSHASLLTRAMAGVLALLLAAPALAHSELRQARPANGATLAAAPEAIELTFNEKVQVTAIRLYAEGGAEIALERQPITERTTERRLLPALQPGAYRVEWRAISADGHPVGGAVRFRIAPP